MHVHPVELDLPLSDDELVDLLLIQWRTPIPGEDNVTPALLAQTIERKREILDRLCAWMVGNHRDCRRPLIVLTPEVSTPVDLLDRVEGLLTQMNRPTIVVAGVEYLDPSQYSNLISQSCNPERERWVQGVDGWEKVNTAVILTRGADGALRKYLQPKIRPADAERAWRVYGAEHVLLFHHRSHAPGAGLHFCVQICSDFCSRTHVALLRERIARAFQNEDLRLDLTLLLQCNRDQEAPQFRDGTNAYFGGPHQAKVRTDAGAILMLNNASATGGISPHWGGSQFRFLYDSWTQPGGEFTYWLSQMSNEEWQAAAFRDSGPSVYWVTYKPRYLCDRRPSEDTHPFVDAVCWRIADGAPSFKPISAVIHWLESEWVTAAGSLVGSLVAQGTQNQVAEAVHTAYQQSVAEWMAALDHERAKGAVSALFASLRSQPGYPYGATKYANTEPMKWRANSEIQRAAREMLRLHALLKMGAAASSTSFAAAPLATCHALLETSVPLTYLWGGGEMMAEKMVSDYRDHVLSVSERASPRCFVVILMSPKTRTEPAELVRRLFEDRVDRASQPNGSGDHLDSSGGVTKGEAWRPVFVYDHSIESALTQSDLDHVKGTLSQCVLTMVGHADGA